MNDLNDLINTAMGNIPRQHIFEKNGSWDGDRGHQNLIWARNFWGFHRRKCRESLDAYKKCLIWSHLALSASNKHWNWRREHKIRFNNFERCLIENDVENRFVFGPKFTNYQHLTRQQTKSLFRSQRWAINRLRCASQ